MADAASLKALALKCRWLARSSHGDVQETLLRMAEEYERQALTLETTIDRDPGTGE